MDKRNIRIEVLDLQDQYCTMCGHRSKQDFDICFVECSIGQRIEQIGIYLGAKPKEKEKEKVGPDKSSIKKRRTRKDWDEICKKAIALREEGLSYALIAKRLGVKHGQEVSYQMKNRGFK
ncbi:hypothetical protein BAMA_16180 [Bacillus manliponensis]|uniref:Zinc-finger domain-containing protein n=1 Tax=Bacillus manliponensis TaxID=574376 RepID=A0A073JSR0_9BACI|nr:zinc-finger domain-containing protein [Bacillus manliponensis]KEK17231.1 hypothetical protein BAMA_16180 [Bacillus manliponensis]